MASPWAKTPKHADWSEQVEEELAQNGGSFSPPEPVPLDDEAFPTLGDAAKVKQPRKKPKGQKMSLGEFVGRRGSSGLGPMSDREIIMNLPTAPRERGPDDDGGWGRGFRGGYRSGGFGGFGDGERRRGRDEDMGPSRAEESDDWGSQKRFVPSGAGGFGGSSRGFGGGGFRDYDRPRSSQGRRYDDAPLSRAADSDNWSRENRFEPSRDRSRPGSRFYEPAPRRGYGFRDRDMDRRGFDRDFGRPDGDMWSRGRSYTPNSESALDPPRGDRPRLNLAPRRKPLDTPSSDRPESTTSAKRSIFGDARPREEVLKERGDAQSCRSDISGSARLGDRGMSDGASDYSSRAGTPASASIREDVRHEHFVPRPRVREDPFGGARPREDNLTRRDSEPEGDVMSPDNPTTRLLEQDAEDELSRGIAAM